MRFKLNSGSGFLAIAVAALMAVPSAAAQTDGGRTIEEVIVTATKRSESARDLPISIDAYTGEDLENRGATGLEEILKYSPGVTFKKGGHADSSSITIRGIGGTSKYFNRTFGLFYQDVSMVNPSLIGPQPDIDPFDMAMVEILKGPQGTLFGGSALAGAVRYVPNRPDMTEGYGSIGYQYGQVSSSDGHNETYTLMYNLPISDQFALRASGAKRKRAGYVDDIFSGESDINTAQSQQQQLLLKWLPSDDWAIDLQYVDRKSENDDSATVENVGNEGNAYYVSRKRTPEDGLSEMEIMGITLESGHFEDFSMTLTSNALEKSGFIHLDLARVYAADEVPGGRSRQEQRYHTDQTSHEFRLVSNDVSESDWWILDNWKYVVGLFYLEADQFTFLDIPAPSISVGAALNQFGVPIGFPVPTEQFVTALLTEASSLAEEKALYFDVTKLLFNDRLEINIGGRYYKQDSTGDIPVFLETRSDSGNNRSLIDTASAALSEEGFNPKLAVIWHFTDDISLLVSAVKGFRFGGFNTDPGKTGEPQPTFGSDELWNYEASLRSNFFDGAMQLDVTAFYLEWSDMQIEEFASNGLYAYVLNIGGSENYGAEMSLKLALPGGFLLMGNAGYSDAVYTEAFTTPSGGSGEEGAGLPNSPQWTGSMILSWQGARNNWIYGADIYYSFQDDSKNDIENHIPLDGFSTWGLSMNLTQTAWPMAPELRLAATNITGERAALFGLFESSGVEISTREVLQPRTISLGLKLNI